MLTQTPNKAHEDEYTDPPDYEGGDAEGLFCHG